MNDIYEELKRIRILWDSLTILRNKAGITVARVETDSKSYVLKYFQDQSFRREIRNYRILSSLEIPTMKVIDMTDSAILLEDIACSSVYRLGSREDMADQEVARRIAVWYQQLHNRGFSYVAQNGSDLYDESDCFTLENIAFIKEKTGTQNAPAWRALERRFDAISAMLCNTRRTLTYNDFYYTNMMVAKDKSSALMFDYNLLGKGYVYTDLRNVMSSLSAEAGNVFLKEYGGYDPAEAALDGVVSVVVALYQACQRETFPSWARCLMQEIDTTFPGKIERLEGYL